MRAGDSLKNLPCNLSLEVNVWQKKERRRKKDLYTIPIQYPTDVLSGGPPSWGLEHRGLCFGCDLFINLQPHDLGTSKEQGGSGRETVLGLPLCRYDTGRSSPLVAAGIEWFHPLLGGDGALIAPTASQTMD